MAITKFTLDIPSIGYQEVINLKVLKPFRVIIKPQNKDIKDLIVGFDEIPKESIVESNYEELKEEYTNGLKQEDFLQSDFEYIPNWISMRTRDDNKVTLDLDWKPDDWLFLNRSAKERAQDYDNICFEAHEDFKIEPLNLKDEKGNLVDNVTVTCLKNNDTPAILKIVTNNKIVGAINVFYPVPKKVKIRLCRVQFNQEDFEDMDKKIKDTDVANCLKQSLAPVLIDAKIILPEKVDITNVSPTNNNLIVMKSHMEGIDRVKATTINEENFLSNLEDIVKGEISIAKDEILLLLTNLMCYKKIGDVDGYINGISFRRGNISCMFLKNTNIHPNVEIPHEIMHAIGLKHTFEENTKRKYIFREKKTENYMDYDNTKKGLFKWQWSQLHRFLNTK